MSVTLAPPPFLQFFNPNNTGSPAVAFQLFTYQAGTSVKQSTWVDSTQTGTNANPLQLNGNGYTAMWGDPTVAYKLVWAPANDTDPPTSPLYTVDNFYFPANLGVITQNFIGSLIYPRTASEIAASVTPVNFWIAPGVVDRYGTNTIPGTTDMSFAVRLALDSVPANGGMIQFLPNGVYLLSSVIYIPQRRNGTTGEGGIIIEGNNCTLIGQGLGAGATGSGVFTTSPAGGNLETQSVPTAIFETGTGSFSTVSKGGATNFGLGNELSTTIHDNDQIRNINFKTFGMALHLFNFILGCKLSNLYFVGGYTAVYDARSFYAQWENLNASFQQAGAGAQGYSAFICTDNVNDRCYIGCHVAGNQLPATPSIGWNLSSMEGCSFVSCSAEQCGKGMVISGQSQGVSITAGYFEVNSVAAISIESTVNALTIEDCEFISTAGNQPVAVQCATGTWFTGRLGINDYRTQDPSNNQILLTNTSNTCQVYVQPRAFTRQGQTGSHTGWTALPSGWSVANGCLLEYQDYIYNDAAGLDHPLAVLSPPVRGNLVAKPYTGTISNTASGQIPFCTTSIAGTNLTVLTKIPFDSAGYGIMFDIVASDNTAVRYISGRTFGGTSVFRYDALAMTVTVSNSGGFFQFVFGNFNVSVSLNGGEIRLS